MYTVWSIYQTTDFLLQRWQPTIVLSGDDHDDCLYQHPSGAHEVRIGRFNLSSIPPSLTTALPSVALMAPAQFTVRTFSWMQGNLRPGYVTVYGLESVRAE